MGKKIGRQEPDRFSSGTTGNGSESQPSHDEKGPHSGENRAAETAPQAELDKKNSSRNAVKFSILSQATLLKGESRAEYESLLEGLWESFQPVGKAEELQVERMATIWWRHLRLLVAEGAEIRKNIEFLGQNGAKQGMGIGTDFFKSRDLISRVYDPNVFERCLESLVELGQGIQASGFDKERDSSILTTIYGESDNADSRQTLQGKYWVWFHTSKATEKERTRKGYATVEECKQIVLREIVVEIKRLRQDHRKSESIKSERRKLEILRQGVPDSPALDRFLRCEASLDQAYDRALTQLERLQRMRKGQPLPPPSDVSNFLRKLQP
jgi:hypothetical protein